MSIEIIKEKVLKYLRELEGSVENCTPKYIGYKVNSKLYAEVAVRKDHINILVNKNYISEEDINKLGIKIMPDNYQWTLNAEIKIFDENNIDDYFTVIYKCYEVVKNEYTDKLKNIIQLTIENNSDYIQKYIAMEEFAFEKLIAKWAEFMKCNISNNSLDELKSEVEALDKFSSGDFLSKYKNIEEKYNFLKLLYEVVAYIDKNGYNKQIYNEYEDKRVLALTFVRQNEWVRSLINYRKYNDLGKVPEIVRNVIIYILSPSDKLSAFKNYKLMQFIKVLRPNSIIESHYDKLCDVIYKELNCYDIQVKNEANRGVVYAHIMFSKELAKLWNVENNFYKIQPFKGTELSRDEVQHNLENNIIAINYRNIKVEDNVKNIFYVADENKAVLLGTFTKEVTERDGLYYRNFIKLEATDKFIDGLNNTKPWGSKNSSKQVIPVKEEDKEDFESEVINDIFEINIDNVLYQIKNYVPSASIGDEDGIVDEPEDIIDDKPFEKEIETPLNMILYGPPGTGKTYNTINYAVSIVEKKEVDEVLIEAKNNRESVFKRYKKYLGEKRIVFTTFHQNYSYEDFIQGIRANTNNTDQLSFIKQDGIFKDLVERAKNDLNNLYVMIIDEINRGNISRIFGELITLIEDDKRLDQPNETSVTLPSKEIFTVPPNLYIIGTMNTADKSIANIDIALRRRFDFIPMYTDYNLIPSFENMLRPINKAIYEKKRCADYLIGHAFFVQRSKDDLCKIVNNKIIPLLNEYFYMNTGEVIEILNRGGIKVKENIDTFQIEYDGIEE